MCACVHSPVEDKGQKNWDQFFLRYCTWVSGLAVVHLLTELPAQGLNNFWALWLADLLNL